MLYLQNGDYLLPIPEEQVLRHKLRPGMHSPYSRRLIVEQPTGAELFPLATILVLERPSVRVNAGARSERHLPGGSQPWWVAINLIRSCRVSKQEWEASLERPLEEARLYWKQVLLRQVPMVVRLARAIHRAPAEEELSTQELFRILRENTVPLESPVPVEVT